MNLVKNGAGTLTISQGQQSGNGNASYNGTTTINAGSVVYNNLATYNSPVTVNAGANVGFNTNLNQSLTAPNLKLPRPQATSPTPLSLTFTQLHAPGASLRIRSNASVTCPHIAPRTLTAYHTQTQPLLHNRCPTTPPAHRSVFEHFLSNLISQLLQMHPTRSCS